MLFGLGAMLGPLLAGRLADRIGFRMALRLGFGIQAAAIALSALTAAATWIAVSSVVAGAFTPGISTLTLGRVHELVEDPGEQRQVWAYATIAWAIAQAVGAYGYAYLYAHFGGYALLFGLGSLALLGALATDLVGPDRPLPLRRRDVHRRY